MSKPLVPDSTVEWVERAQRARHEPASPDSQVVGALNQLIAVLRAAAAPWSTAGERAAAAELTASLAEEARGIASLADRLERPVKDRGGSPASAADGAGELPRPSADFEYAQSDREIEALIAENRSRVAAACERALECEHVPDADREAIVALRQRLAG